MDNENRSMTSKIQDILLHYRATPLACGRSPAELYLHRPLRIKLDAIRPFHHTTNSPSDAHVRIFKVGERVQVRDYSQNKYIWMFGEIIEKLGVLHYIVKLDSGRTLKRHLDQIRPTSVKKVRFGDEPPQPENPNASTPLQVPTVQLPTPAPMIFPDPRPPTPTPIPPPPAPPELRRSTRVRRRPAYLRDYVV
ncbi:Hypothetical Protein NTJ_03872 [Nesidiocoris tenuis]|uniref:SH3 domain-containing protein n=2 Tax=Nesidiocoris tenuis TaxID=355587 RepID=A0ABN7AIN6_9HEMI|nr:Hypothetical Protein NTJ_03872 [Nesidiocoris tenuis]